MGKSKATNKPTVHLLHGICGSGKTTFAKQLAAEVNGIRFTLDEWMHALYGADPSAEQFDELWQRVDELIWQQVAQLVRLGIDVIMDYGFWTRQSRDAARERVAALGAKHVLYRINCDVHIARKRVLQRTANLSTESLHINAETFDLLLQRVEPLEVDEACVAVENH